MLHSTLETISYVAEINSVSSAFFVCILYAELFSAEDPQEINNKQESEY